MENSKDIKMSEGERTVLLMLDKTYKWIARNREGELLIFKYKPTRSKKYEKTCFWHDWMDETYTDLSLAAFDHLFSFIKFDDEEPWLIAELTQIRKELQQ